jgi:hypothetical protein
VPTKAELLALDYSGTSPQSSGMTAEDYRREYRLHGRPVRWWKAVYLPEGETGPDGEAREKNGYCFIEQLTAIDGVTALTEIRAMFWGTQRMFPHEQFGVVSRGSQEIGVLPDEIHLAKPDRVCLTDVAWLQRQFVTRGATDTDLLTFKPVAEIVSVVVEGEVVSVEDYEDVDTGIRWLSGAPSAGTKYHVEYKHHPLFEFLGSEKQIVQKGADGLYLPQRGTIQFIQPTSARTTY